MSLTNKILILRIQCSVAQVTHVTPAVYPRLLVNLKFSYLSIKKNIKTKLTLFPWFSRASQSKFEANRSSGSYDRTKKHRLQLIKHPWFCLQVITWLRNYTDVILFAIVGGLIYKEWSLFYNSSLYKWVSFNDLL